MKATTHLPNRPRGRRQQPQRSPAPDAVCTACIVDQLARSGGVHGQRALRRIGRGKACGCSPEASLERISSRRVHNDDLYFGSKLPSLDDPIPNDFNHLHFGAGQTEAIVNLPPRTHTLQLMLGDDNHVPHNPPVMSKPIKAIVTRTGRRPGG